MGKKDNFSKGLAITGTVLAWLPPGCAGASDRPARPHSPDRGRNGGGAGDGDCRGHTYAGARPQFPNQMTFKQAERVKESGPAQGRLFE